MAVTNGYCASADLQAWLQSPAGDVATAAVLDTVVTSVSRWIDNYCGQKFWLDPTPVARTFTVTNRYAMSFDGDGIGDSTITVRSDSSGDGVFETTWSASDYQLTPPNAPTAGAEPRAWTGLRAVGAKTMPIPYTSLLARTDRLQITAKWGWPAIPAQVTQACLMQSARTLKRRYSPEGVAGFGEFGAVRVNSLDVDVQRLLADYRLGDTVVAFA